VRITVVADPPDNDLRVTAEKLVGATRVTSLAALEAMLDRLPPVPGGGATLDLVAHTTGPKLLRLGATVLDPETPRVAATFARLGREGVLPRLGIAALRLLGCRSGRQRGAEAVVAFADLLGVRVYGTTANLRSRHYDSEGLDPAAEVLLASDLLLRRQVSSRSLLPDLDPRQSRSRQ